MFPTYIYKYSPSLTRSSFLSILLHPWVRLNATRYPDENYGWSYGIPTALYGCHIGHTATQIFIIVVESVLKIGWCRTPSL